MFAGINGKANIINQIFIGVNNRAKLIYSGSGVAGFELPSFTGSHTIFGDKNAGRIELYESGTLTLAPGTYDFFAVGGGGSGGVATRSDVTNNTPGGGGGYTNTKSGYSVPRKYACQVQIGAGGTNGSGGGTIVRTPDGQIVISANPGGSQQILSSKTYGGNGGSGGGAYSSGGNGGAGGSDGSNGRFGTNYGKYTGVGTGQGTTTRMFAEATNTLFAGGGGGSAGGRGYSVGAGGAGGGGASGMNQNGTAGTPNTGGGGGGFYDGNTSSTIRPGVGGSGIIVIRWNNVA